MNASVETIQRINQKLQHLVKQRDGLQRENERLHQDVGHKQEQLSGLKEKVAFLEDQVAILKAAAMQLDDKGRKDFEKRINGFIRDIDKVIAHIQS